MPFIIPDSLKQRIIESETEEYAPYSETIKEIVTGLNGIRYNFSYIERVDFEFYLRLFNSVGNTNYHTVRVQQALIMRGTIVGSGTCPLISLISHSEANFCVLCYGNVDESGVKIENKVQLEASIMDFLESEEAQSFILYCLQ